MTVFPQDHLRTLASIRERCSQVYEKSKRGELTCFDIDESVLPTIVDHVASTTTRRYPQLDKILPHSRLRHFNPIQIKELKASWEEKGVDAVEQSRRLIDLVIVSVLVDAGAGQKWKYKTNNGEFIGRSEGLAIASYDMFLNGYFSSSRDLPDRVDARGLDQVTVQRMTDGFQVTDDNPMVGLEGRSNLLKRLAKVLDDQSTYFPSINDEPRRPGNLVDYLLESVEHEQTQAKTVRIEKLWEAVMSLGEMWPARVQINGVQLGDVWPCACLTDLGNYENLVPFHKLSQWLTYSLIEVIESSLGIIIDGVELMTGLPEYRNGGLLVDYGLLTLKPSEDARGKLKSGDLPEFEGSDPVIVEWRALTVIYLDIIKKELEVKLGQKLDLAQILEGGTWTAGREIAAKLRPKDGGPPIVIKSDGTIF
ncbi:hypothetical protein BDF21DRAFT_330370 [Thamnidium elegans]|nr:hypothetical protein BDF21DRAFT_330370 [Thamnidium elegans]